MSNRLLPQHAALLTASAINEEVAQARGYRSVEQKARLTELGFSSAQARVPALLIPIRNAQGEIELYQTRADEPRIVNGKAVKYEIPAGSRMVLDVPPTCQVNLGNLGVPLFVTEGIRKADAAASLDLCCVALLGVWNFRGSNALGGTTALADWESIALNGRVVYVVFDSDVMTKSGVYQALVRLRAFLQSRHANVHLIYLPVGLAGAKVGLDDFLAAGHSVDDLLALATTDLRAAPGSNQGTVLPYRETPAGMVWDRPVGDGSVPIALTNFRARIVAQVVEDDGAEQHRLFEIEGTLGHRTPHFRLPAAVFGPMNWPAEHLGANAVTYAGMGLRDHARVAIQLLSGDVPERTVYTHLGWREIDNAWIYLHGGGAIGPDGTVHDGIETRLDGPLARYILPDPPTGAALQAAVRASLRLLELGPDRLTVAVLAATYRAVLGPTDFSLHLAGPTGVFKSELAALAVQHFGAAMDSRNLPGSWTSTGNSLEALAFAAKDAVFVVDDFAPTGSSGDVLRLHRDADRLLRAQGNSSGRQRMRADTTLRPPKPPRGLILSTGEDVPRGQSLRARILVLEVEPGDIDTTTLSACQADAAAGLMSAAMAGFIHSIAGRQGEIRTGLRAEIAKLRGEARGSRAHRRTPDIVANLAIGIEHFLTFAESVGAVTTGERSALAERCWRALGAAAASQAEHQAASEPTARFLELLAAAITAGRAHVAGEDGERPANPGAWGWRRETQGSAGFERETWRAGRERVGWLVEDALFLDPDAAFSAAQSMGRDTDDPLAIQPRTLRSRLHQRGLLVSIEDDRHRLTIRRVLDGKRRAVLHLAACVLDGVSQPSQPAHGERNDAGEGPLAWATRDEAPTGMAHKVAHTVHDQPAAGPDGTVGPLDWGKESKTRAAAVPRDPFSGDLDEPDEEISTWMA